MGRKKKSIDDRAKRIADEAYKNDMQVMEERIRTKVRETPFHDLPPATQDALDNKLRNAMGVGPLSDRDKAVMDYWINGISRANKELINYIAARTTPPPQPPSPSSLSSFGPPTELQVKQLNDQIGKLVDMLMDYMMKSRLGFGFRT